MRIAGLGNYHKHLTFFTYGIMEGAIRNGARFMPYGFYTDGDLIDNLEKQLNIFKPHIMLCHVILNNRHPFIEDRPDWPERARFYDMLHRVRKKGIKICYQMGDARKEPRWQQPINEFMDFVLLNHGLLKEYSEILKVPAYHWPYGCLYQETLGEVRDIFKAKVVFTGNRRYSGIHEERTRFIDRLNEKIEVKCFPNETFGNTRFHTADIAVSADVVLGVHMGWDIPSYLDVRPFQYIGAGALYFHDKCDSIDYFFKDGVHYVSYERGNVGDFVDKYNYYVVKHPNEGNKIRMRGFEFCQKNHSYKERINQVINVVQ